MTSFSFTPDLLRPNPEAEYQDTLVAQRAADLEAAGPQNMIPYFPPRDADKAKARLAAAGVFPETVREARSAQYLRRATRQILDLSLVNSVVSSDMISQYPSIRPVEENSLFGRDRYTLPGHITAKRFEEKPSRHSQIAFDQEELRIIPEKPFNS